jgi:flagellar assembly factor FliW
MRIETSRFGMVDVDESRLIHFPKGVLGFPGQTRYALIQTGEQSSFYWLQAVDRADLAFVVCDPTVFVPDYRVPIKADEMEQLGLSDPSAAQVMVIVNKVDGLLTGNLQGPLVIHCQTRVARQLVLSDSRYTTRHPLMRLPQREAAISRTA